MVYTVTNNNNNNVRQKVETGSVLKELFIAFIASIPFFTQGIETIHLSSSIHSGHFLPEEEMPWSTTAFVLAAAVAALIFTYSVDKLGRRVAVFAISIVQGASLIPLFLLSSTNTIIFHALAGASTGGIFTVLPVYITETTSPRIRGPCLGLMLVLTSAGYMMKLALGFEELMYLMTALVMAQLVTMINIVETPSYLVMSGNLEKAKKTIASLKMLPENSVAAEKELDSLKNQKEKALCNGITFCTFYRNKIWWDSIKMSGVLFTTTVLCGSIVFLDQDKTLMQLKMSGDPENILVLSSMFAGSLFGFLGIIILDRKYLLTIGYTTMALASGVIAVYTQVDLTVTSLQWLAIVSLVALVFGYGMSWALPLAVLVEVFNFEIRATIIGVVFAFSQLVKLAHVHTFQYIEDYVGIYTTFYIFACINLYGAVYTLFIVPNIRNKSLVQIEKQIKRTPLPA